MTDWLVVVHLAAAAMLAGIGWLTQFAVYPQFRRIAPEAWPGYHAAHSTALGRTVVIPWVVQGVTTGALLLQRPDGVPVWLLVVDALLAAGPVAITALVAVPLHRTLSAGPDAASIDALLRANLVRSIAWTAATGTGCAMAILVG